VQLRHFAGENIPRIANASAQTGQRAKARLSINVWIAHAGAFGNQYLSEPVLFVQRISQFRQDRTQLVRVF
jgi:hypothetical protein